MAYVSEAGIRVAIEIDVDKRVAVIEGDEALWGRAAARYDARHDLLWAIHGHARGKWGADFIGRLTDLHRAEFALVGMEYPGAFALCPELEDLYE